MQNIYHLLFYCIAFLWGVYCGNKEIGLRFRFWIILLALIAMNTSMIKFVF